MGEVDLEQARLRACEKADQAVRYSFHPRDRECMAAQLLWAREFKKQFDAYTKRTP